jgi:hypothetical protein
MANLNHLCRSLLHAMDTGKRDLENHIVLQIRAVLAQVEPEGEVSDDELHDAFYRHSFEDFRQRLMTWQEFHAGARAAIALARSRRAPVPPADEEVKDVSQLSDGYHTFAELYEHRHALMLAFMRAAPDLCWFSRRHADGELCFGDGEWFIVGAELPNSGTVSYHLPMRLWGLAEMTGAAELELGRPWDGHTAHDVVQRLTEWASSSHALSQPEPPAEGEVSDDELPPRVGHILRLAEIIREVDGNHDKGAAALAEAILSHPDICLAGLAAPVPPAEGEVGELVDQIHQIALAWEPDACLLGNMTAEQLARAADLLAQRHPAPVPVSERLPEPEDCDAEGRCWLCGKVEGDWRLLNPKNSGVPQLKYCFSHWLPAHAIPIPRSEND